MYFLLPAYADSHARLTKSYGGQGLCLWLNALRVSAVVPQHGTKADMLRRVSPDEESGGAMPACRQAWASPVGLHKFCFASQKTYVNTLNELIYS